MKRCLAAVTVCLAITVQLVNGQSSISYNDQAIQLIEEGRHWEAIKSLECAKRSGGKQANVAHENLERLRQQLDLPSHTLLHFGWKHGIGALCSRLPGNTWMIASLIALFTLIVLLIRQRDWSFKKALGFLLFALLCFVFSWLREAYIQSADLVIFMQDEQLLDKPYTSGEVKQTVFEGQIARMEGAYEGYRFVQTDTYDYGWVSEERITSIWSNQYK